MTLRSKNSLTRLLCAALLMVYGIAGGALAATTTDGAGTQPAAGLDNPGCMKCHDGREKLNVAGADGEERPLRTIDAETYAKGVHAAMTCVACHTNIADNEAPHKKTEALKVDCAGCHEALLARARQDGTLAARPRLEVVVKNAEAYKKSFHARPDADHPTRPKATCDQCHDTHAFNVPEKKGTPEHDAWRRTVPRLCGESCHEDHLEDFTESVHGVALLEEKKGEAATCSDCHTTHDIAGTSAPPTKLLITSNCGGCHEENYKTYKSTYHGQVHSLGFAYTAKCFDCHGSHAIKKVDDPESKVHPDNRLKTCQKCHDGKKMPLATAGFVSWGPHAHAGDFERYPQMWIASRFMVGLLLGVFAFFWLHSGLWYYREWKDRKEGKSRSLVRTAALRLDETKHVRRFGLGWRIAHLVFALVTMTLVLTGTTALYADGPWAPAVAKALGGPNIVGLIHRVAAALFVGIFSAHFLFVMYHLLVRKRASFRWFGPDSLIPNWKDFADCWGMFKWFVGKGQRPAFDRWAYFEKFDYWAVFWGVNIIGFSGLMLAFPHITASYMPGWVFNVATLVHGEEAFLAAVFLFTVHFFNNHFRPDKLPPPDIVMFTGTQSIEEFKRDHPAQYDRLASSGELRKYLVDAPSSPMTLGSKILGLSLIACGLILLVLVAVGFFGGFAQ